ncbi:MAG: carboxypeptidase regulatory-like domain-containing protein, partial [Pseudonocardia sp.]|nr:carboxypeptidase regulatory-like domain-containing protein [Pseudonocardia sp.]
VRGASPIESGFLILPLVAGIMTASVTSGQLTARTGRYKVFPTVGTLLMTGALVILYFRVNVAIPFWELDIYMAMFGLGLGGCMQTLVLAVQNASPAKDMGVVTASSTFFRQLGGTLGTAVFFSILFSTLPDKISAAMASATRTDPAFQAAMADPAVRANPVNAPFFALLQGGGANVLNDSAFLQTIDARLAHPILVGFTNSITLVFLVAACVIAVAFVLIFFVKELPLRTMSGARAAAMEEAARTGEVPAAVAPEAVPIPAAGRHSLAPASAPSPANGVAVWSGGTPQPVGAEHADDESPEIDTAPLVADAPGVVGTATRADGKGLSTVVVTVADPAGRQEARAITDSNGRYAIPLRSPGTYLVVAAAGAYQPHAALVAVGPDTATRHDVMLCGTSGVHGIVRHGEDAVAGAAVTLIDAHGDVAAVGVTDAAGCYRLVGVPDGAYTLTAASAGHQPAAVSLWLDVGMTVERTVDLPRRSRLVGTVTAASSGRPIGEATTTLVDAGGVVVATTVTDGEGGFAFADLPAGTYTLLARGYAPTAQTVHITAGVDATAAITLGKGPRVAPEPEAARPVH